MMKVVLYRGFGTNILPNSFVGQSEGKVVDLLANSEPVRYLHAFILRPI